MLVDGEAGAELGSLSTIRATKALVSLCGWHEEVNWEQRCRCLTLGR